MDEEVNLLSMEEFAARLREAGWPEDEIWAEVKRIQDQEDNL